MSRLSIVTVMLTCFAGRPEDSGIALQTVQELGSEFPIFGVCMGHQCIGQVFGGNIIKAPSGVMHGKTSPVHHTNQGLMKVGSDLLPAITALANYSSLPEAEQHYCALQCDNCACNATTVLCNVTKAMQALSP